MRRAEGPAPPPFRPHVLGLDDGPFDKRRDATTPIVAVMTEGADLVEGVAVTRFPIDGDGATEFLATWIAGLRLAPALHAVVLGGLTVAGLGVLDLTELSARLGVPAMAVHRRPPRDEPLLAALQAAGLARRIPLIERAPPAWALEPGVFVTLAGTSRDEAERILRAARGKSRLPEPLRLAHMIGAALVAGQSRGRV
jgi:endonuclease V-like protein UPF0215 family